MFRTRPSRSLLLVLYLVIGVLVAAGVIGDDNYFPRAQQLKELADAALAIILWPLVLLGVGFNIAGTDTARSKSRGLSGRPRLRTP